MTQSRQSSEDSDQNRRLSEILSDLLDGADETELEFISLHEGEVLFEQGAEGDSMYILKAGVLGVRIKEADGRESELARLTPGAVVGELALLSGSKRSATVYALNDVGLLRLTQAQFQQFMEEDQSALAAMSATAIPRWQRQQIFKALRTLLGDIDPAALDALQEQLAWQYNANGDVIFRQGDPSDGMYIVVNGRLRTTLTRADGSEKDLGEIGPGEPVGEMGVLTDAARSATVHAVRETNLVKITPAKFRRLIRQYPDLMINIARIIVERQQRFMQGVEQQHAGSLTLAIVPGGINLDGALFAQELSRSLARYGSTLALNSDGFDEKYGEPLASQSDLDDIGNTAIVAWMNELDLAAQYVLYVADPFPSPWTRRCIGHADRVLILADPASDPQPGAAERMLDELEVLVRSDLVFWYYPASESLPEISAWLEPRSVEAHHFVRRGDEEQMNRLAGRLSG